MQAAPDIVVRYAELRCAARGAFQAHNHATGGSLAASAEALYSAPDATHHEALDQLALWFQDHPASTDAAAALASIKQRCVRPPDPPLESVEAAHQASPFFAMYSRAWDSTPAACRTMFVRTGAGTAEEYDEPGFDAERGAFEDVMRDVITVYLLTVAVGVTGAPPPVPVEVPDEVMACAGVA